MAITIIEIGAEIAAGEGKRTKNAQKTHAEEQNWRPQKAEEYNLPAINLPRLTAPNRKRLARVLAFIDAVKYKRYKDGATIMPIPTTNKQLISICGSQREVSRLIQFMTAIGLVSIADDTFYFGADGGKSKTYFYYRENEEKILSYCEENHINKYVVKNININPLLDKFSIDNFDEKQVVFSSELHLLKPDNYSMSQFEDYLTNVLRANYPQLIHYQQLADEINEKYYKDYPEMSLRFVPSFTWAKGNKSVRKIGIRCVNSLVSAKKTKAGAENYSGFYRDDILERYKLNLVKDVKSSVPRITLSINSGWWITEDIDIYEIIYNVYMRERKKEGNINPLLDNFLSARDAIKSLHMRAYFDKENMLGAHTRLAMAHVEDKNAVDEEMKLYRRAIVEAEGNCLYGNEIFLHESCIYLDVLKELLDNGYFVWLCYDAFYARKNNITQPDFEKYCAEIIAQKANAYIRALNNGGNEYELEPAI